MSVGAWNDVTGGLRVIFRGGQQQAASDRTDPEAADRWARIARRAAQASHREAADRSTGGLRLELTEALLIAHDLYMLGEIEDEPSLRWTVAAAESALSPWQVTVVPDGALTWNRRPFPG